MKKLYFMLVALFVAMTAKADWTFYVDTTNNGWSTVNIHCGNGTGWWQWKTGTKVAENVFKFELVGWDDLSRISFTKDTKNNTPSSGAYGEFTLNNDAADWRLVSGACYKLNASGNGAQVILNYTVPTTPTPDPDPDVEAKTYTVSFDNGKTAWTEVYAYVWDANDNKVANWPGTKMTAPAAGSTVWTYTFETTITPAYIIFNNNSGVQTDDLDFVNNKTYGDPAGTPDPEMPTYTVSFDNGKTAWTEVYAYVWNGSKNVKAWPGEKMTAPAAGSTVWTYTFETTITPAYIIFNNNSGVQTEDLPFENNKTYGEAAEQGGEEAAVVELRGFNDWVHAIVAEIQEEDGTHFAQFVIENYTNGTGSGAGFKFHYNDKWYGGTFDAPYDEWKQASTEGNNIVLPADAEGATVTIIFDVDEYLFVVAYEPVTPVLGKLTYTEAGDYEDGTKVTIKWANASHLLLGYAEMPLDPVELGEENMGIGQESKMALINGDTFEYTLDASRFAGLVILDVKAYQLPANASQAEIMDAEPAGIASEVAEDDFIDGLVYTVHAKDYSGYELSIAYPGNNWNFLVNVNDNWTVNTAAMANAEGIAVLDEHSIGQTAFDGNLQGMMKLKVWDGSKDTYFVAGEINALNEWVALTPAENNTDASHIAVNCLANVVKANVEFDVKNNKVRIVTAKGKEVELKGAFDGWTDGLKAEAKDNVATFIVENYTNGTGEGAGIKFLIDGVWTGVAADFAGVENGEWFALQHENSSKNIDLAEAEGKEVVIQIALDTMTARASWVVEAVEHVIDLYVAVPNDLNWSDCKAHIWKGSKYVDVELTTRQKAPATEIDRTKNTVYHLSETLNFVPEKMIFYTGDYADKTVDLDAAQAGTIVIGGDTEKARTADYSTTGIEAIEADNAAPVYYNLQGVRVAEPTNGLYIVVRGGKTSKVLVK